MRARGPWLGPTATAVFAVGLAWTPAGEAVPGLGLLAGPLGLAFIALAAGVSATRARAGHPLPPFRDGVLFVASMAFFLGMGLPFVHQVQASGDEVEYLLMAQSLWKEGDLDVRDNWARGDYLDYVPGMAQPMFGTVTAGGIPISTHSPGLPAILAPIYALGGRKAAVVFMALLASWLAVLTRHIAFRLTNEHGAALAAWAAVVVSPVAFYTFYLYTEVPSALALTLALGILLGSPSPLAAGSAAFALGVLPWLHIKMVPAAVVLGVFAVVRLRGRSLVAFVAVAATMALAFVTYYQIVFGHPTPLALYGAKTPKQVRNATPFVAIPGLLLDASFGLLPHAPVFLAALAGLPLVLRRSRQECCVLVAVAVAILAPLVTWRVWWAGFCPPARFLVPLVPLLAVALALLVRRGMGLARWIPGLLGFGFGLVAFMSVEPSETRMVNGRDEPTRVWTALEGRVSADRLLPHLAHRSSPEWSRAIVAAGLIVVLLLLDVLALRLRRVDRLFRTLLLPLGLLVAGASALELLGRYPAGP